ncbi:carbohydrate porin [Photobacterium sagamiensis]|uniref:carbohydrate porin n=1 Tax=Photobacterium sagamiensis TaxID=2910241 RepID=UPI003D09AF7B
MFFKHKKSLVSFSLLLAISINSTLASDKGTTFGGPDSVDNTIADNKKGPQKAFRARWAEDHGFTFGLDYHALGLTATNTLPGTDESSASGVARFYGSWNLIGRESGNTGGVVWKIEHRHAYTDTAPKDFGLGNIGMAGMAAPAYSDQGGRLTNLYWKQKLSVGKTSFMVGFFDTTDYVDTYALASPWSGFSNLVFSTGAAAIGLPDDASFGIAAGHMFTDNIYGIAGITDGNADSSKPFDGFDTFFNENEYFTTAELGWTASQDRIYTDNVHLTYWHLDGGTKNSIKDSQGINFSVSYFATPQIMPFIRGGFSEGDATLLSSSISAGFGYFGLGTPTNNLGFAINWGEVNEEAFGSGFDDQYIAEIYYNIAMTKHINITPDIQYVKNPALNGEDNVWVFGIRAGISI